MSKKKELLYQYKRFKTFNKIEGSKEYKEIYKKQKEGVKNQLLGLELERTIIELNKTIKNNFGGVNVKPLLDELKEIKRRALK